MRKPVVRPEQVADNVRRFETEVERSRELRSTLGHVHAWYAVRDGSVWRFGSSKFVGYADNTAERYLKTRRGNADGRETEKAMSQWFSPIDPGSRLGRELATALTGFLARWNKVPRRGARISIVPEEAGADAGSTPMPGDERLLARIAIDPEICGGRPHIKGTRVRVSDVVDMIAHGASADEIVADYPYLGREDIFAALAYAARATDHRVIRAA
jgi:uncharacterized protein (DUF433 family)